ncbi:MAG: site-specific integrase [Acidobacteria bacterium]|nr:site-specific integrase [Acidobacteriota bacterium]MCA1627665.1 site-specific integrase [Acidobacteriota bacterium]
MAGQIIKRNERTWLVRVSRGRNASGRRQYFNKTIYGTKKDAQTYLNKKLTEKSTGTLIPATRLTLDEFLDQWLDVSARPRLRERTFEHYKELLDRYVRKQFGAHRLTSIQALDIQKLYAEMQSRGLSARTVRYIHAVLTSALKQAVRWGMLTINPASLVDLPKQEHREMQALSPEQAIAFQKEAAKDRNGIVFNFALVTGMRPEEYLALKWTDVDLERGNATVRRTLVWLKGGGWKFGEPKTARSRRTVSFPLQLARALMCHKREQAEGRLKAGPNYENNDLVFTASDGKPHNLRNLTQRHFKPIFKRAGLPTIRLYDLRHSCATLLLSANEHPKVVSERLGHASITLTLDTYSHVLPSMQQAASEKLERILYR